jgi:hypothetical protein
MEIHMSQQDDPKAPANAENTDLDTDELDQVSGGAAVDWFHKIDTTESSLNPQPLPP